MKECKVICLVPPVHLPDLDRTLEKKGEVIWLSEGEAKSSAVLWWQKEAGTIDARWQERCRVKRDESKTHTPPYLKNLRPSPVPTPETPEPNVDVDEIARVTREEAVAGMREEMAAFKGDMAQLVAEALKKTEGKPTTAPEIAEIIKTAVAEGVAAAGVAGTGVVTAKDDHPTFIPDKLVKKGGKKVAVKAETTSDADLDAATEALKAAKKKKPGPKPKKKPGPKPKKKPTAGGK